MLIAWKAAAWAFAVLLAFWRTVDRFMVLPYIFAGHVKDHDVLDLRESVRFFDRRQLEHAGLVFFVDLAGEDRGAVVGVCQVVPDQIIRDDFLDALLVDVQVQRQIRELHAALLFRLVHHGGVHRPDGVSFLDPLEAVPDFSRAESAC